MNILIITTEIGLDGGGMALACKRVVDILKKEHNVKVLSSIENPIYTVRGGINKNTENGIRMEYKLKQDSLAYKNVDVIIAFGGIFNGYYSAMLAENLCKRFILVLRGSDINIVKWSVDDNWYLRESIIRASKIVCLSNEMIRNVIRLCPIANGKTIIIPNEYDVDVVKFNFHNLSSTINIGTAASHLNEKKGVGNLIIMLKKFKEISKAEIYLNLVGEIDDDLLENYQNEVRAYNIEKNVRFLGYQPRESLREIMKDWDFYIQASVCEGHPNAIGESLQCGTGFISSKTGFIAETLQEQFKEFFFENFDPEVMANNLKALCCMPHLAERYQETIGILKNNCAKEKIVREWLGLMSYSKSPQRDLDIENIVCVGLHDVMGNIHDSITTPINVFRNFVEYVAGKGYGICSMQNYLTKGKEDRKKWIVCTFDDGYKSLTRDALEILKKQRFTATVFVCTGLIGKDNSWNNKDATLREHLDVNDIYLLAKEGWEIASHGVLHKNLLKLNDAEIEYELFESKQTLNQLVGNCNTYAYPYGAYNKFIRHCVEKYYEYAFTVDQGGTSMVVDKHQLKRYSITEIYKMLNQ